MPNSRAWDAQGASSWCCQLMACLTSSHIWDVVCLTDSVHVIYLVSFTFNLTPYLKFLDII
jgi:hypothetical protein